MSSNFVGMRDTRQMNAARAPLFFLIIGYRFACDIRDMGYINYNPYCDYCSHSVGCQKVRRTWMEVS